MCRPAVLTAFFLAVKVRQPLPSDAFSSFPAVSHRTGSRENSLNSDTQWWGKSYLQQTRAATSMMRLEGGKMSAGELGGASHGSFVRPLKGSVPATRESSIVRQRRRIGVTITSSKSIRRPQQKRNLVQLRMYDDEGSEDKEYTDTSIQSSSVTPSNKSKSEGQKNIDNKTVDGDDISRQWKNLLSSTELKFIESYDRFLSLLPPPLAKFLSRTIAKMLECAPTLRTVGFSFLAGSVITITAVVVPILTSIDKFTEPVTLFETILSDLDRGYVDKVDTQKLFETGVSAMLKSLDPYTEFEGRQEAVEMQESVSGKYGGVGLVISGRDRKVLDPSKAGVDRLASDDVDAGTGATSDESSISMNTDSDSASPSPSEAKEEQSPGLQLQQKKDSTALEIAKKEEDGNDGIRVVSAFEGYAFDAGMRVGDKIVAVDDYKIGPETTVEAVRNHLRGDPGTFVAVSFLRDGVDGVQTVDVPRQIVKIHDVKAVTLLGNANEGVGYIQLSGFSQDAGREMRAAITALQRKAEIASNSDSSLKGLILDLRQNPGGLLTSAVDVASLLVPKNSDIVSARGRDFPSVLYRSRVDPLVDPSTRLVVLVSGNTASAAEIVTGAVQDLDVGVILGSDKTYGKGLVQNVEELPFETALKFTVAKYYTPSGRCIQSTNYAEGGGLEGDSGFKATTVEEKDKSEFYTTRGRLVKDGGGIEADVKVPVPKASALEVTLLRENLLNEFASQWSKTNALANSFEVTDDMYDDFQKFVMAKQDKNEVDLLGLIYASPIDALKKTLKQSGYKRSLNRELEALRGSILHEMKSDFAKYKKDLKEDIGQAVLARYLPESMLIARGAQDDVQVKAAMKLIRSGEKFNSILARNSEEIASFTPKNSIRQLASDGKDRLATNSLGAIATDTSNNQGGVQLNVK